MATLAEMNVIIGAQIDDFERKMAAVEKGIGRVGDYAKEAGQSLTTYVTLPLGLLAGAAVKAASDIQALERGFAATYKGSEDLSVALAKVKELAKLPGLGLQEALQGATNLQAAGLSADLARRSLGAFGNALATVGRGKADLEGVGLALGQIAAKGKVSAEEINQLAERVPQIRQAMIAAFGTADTEVLQKAKITANAFVEGVTSELEKLPKVTGGIKNALENLSDAATIALSKLGNSLNTAFDIEGFANRAGEALQSMADAFAQLDPATQKTILVFAGLAAAAGPVLFAVGAIGAAIPAIVAGFAALTGPVGLAVLGITAASVALIGLSTSTRTTGLSLEDQKAKVQGLEKSIAPLLDRYDQLKGRASLNKSEQDELKRIIGQVADQMPSVVTAFDSYGNALDINSGKGRAFIEQQQAVLRGMNVQKIAEQNAKLRELATQIIETQQALNTPFKTVTTDVEYAPDKYRRVKETVSLTDAELAKLRATLQGLNKEFNDGDAYLKSLKGELTATGEAADGAGNKIDAAGDKQAKALAKLNKELLDNANASRALGDLYEYLPGKAKVLETGIKNLTDAGFAPAGKVVQDYVAQLRAVPKELDQIAQRVAKGAAAAAVPEFKLALPELKSIPDQLSANLNLGQIIGLDRLRQQSADLTSIYNGLTTAQREAIAEMETFNVGAGAALEQMNSIIVSGLADVASSMIQGIVNISTGEASAGDIGAVLLGAVGDMLVQLGQLAIATGITMIGIKKAFSNPYTAIIAGAAAIALGAYASSRAQAIASGPSGGASGGGVGAGASLSSAPRNNYSPTVAPGAASQSGSTTHTITVRMAGRDLVGALELEVDRLGRITGR